MPGFFARKTSYRGGLQPRPLRPDWPRARDHAVELPFWQVFRFAAPALVAGNRLLARAERAAVRLAIEDIFRGGAPDGVFQTLLD